MDFKTSRHFQIYQGLPLAGLAPHCLPQALLFLTFFLRRGRLFNKVARNRYLYILLKSYPSTSSLSQTHVQIPKSCLPKSVFKECSEMRLIMSRGISRIRYLSSRSRFCLVLPSVFGGQISSGISRSSGRRLPLETSPTIGRYVRARIQTLAPNASTYAFVHFLRLRKSHYAVSHEWQVWQSFPQTHEDLNVNACNAVALLFACALKVDSRAARPYIVIHVRYTRLGRIRCPTYDAPW